MGIGISAGREQRATARGGWTGARGLLRALGAAMALLACAGAAGAVEKTAVALHGEPSYPPGFDHFSYARPDAPKGGRFTFGVVGGFDTVNPFAAKGTPAIGLREGIGGANVYESLMERSYDEAFSLYGLVAETIDIADDGTAVTFRLRPEARFSDGTRITPADLVFTIETLKEKGVPYMRLNYANVAKAEALDDFRVKFTFKDASNRELPFILALMPILPAHAWAGREFEQTTFEPPVGSGPYVVDRVEPGQRITLKRDPNYWGRDLPIRRGLYNFDEIRYEYYRDTNVLFEAFKKGLVDVLPETAPGRWAQAYDFPAVREGEVVKEEFATALPSGMAGFAINTRRPLLKDRRVREALVRLYDFEWANKNLFFGLYRRTGSFFQGSELASPGHAIDARERAILGAAADTLPEAFAAGTWRPPSTDGSGRDRTVLKAAFDELTAAGWVLQGNRLVDAKTKQPFEIEMLCATREQERVAIGYQRTLALIGIDARVRTVDASQFELRRRTFDFDLLFWNWGASLSPGNEQINRWSSGAADREGSLNMSGVREPGVDAAIRALTAARSREDLVAAARALDRLLLAGYYVVPLFHVPKQWIGRWTRIEHPEHSAAWGYVLPAWWAKP